MKGVIRHDITRRRTLKKKNELLSTYGIYTLSFSYAMVVMYIGYRKMYPKEYQTEKE